MSSNEVPTLSVHDRQRANHLLMLEFGDRKDFDDPRVELAALKLLTHSPGESYEVYMRRIADARGQAGQLARTVKLADLNDHLSHPLIPAGAPGYAWARERLLTRGDPHLLFPQTSNQSL